MKHEFGDIGTDDVEYVNCDEWGASGDEEPCFVQVFAF